MPIPKLPFPFIGFYEWFCFTYSQKSIRIPYLRMLFGHFRLKIIRKWNFITIHADYKVNFSFYWISRMVLCCPSSKKHSYPLFAYAFWSFSLKNHSEVEFYYNSCRFQSCFFLLLDFANGFVLSTLKKAFVSPICVCFLVIFA